MKYIGDIIEGNQLKNISLNDFLNKERGVWYDL